MQVLVLGAGVVGTTTAYFLAEAGHRVTVIDREPAPARETSFANGGQISACHAKPWAGPGVPWQAFKWMFAPDAPLLMKPLRWDPSLWRWGLQFLANCTTERARVNMDRTLRVALYSRAVLKALRQHTNIQYAQELRGILHIYRTTESFAEGRATGAMLAQLGLPQDVMTRAECIAVEPALRDAPHLAGGLMSPDDESGDAHLFTEQLAGLARKLGVNFHFGETVQTLERERGCISGVVTDRTRYTPDAVVLCLGTHSPTFVKPLGITLPIYPAKGYSISIEIEQPDAAPHVSSTDETKYLVFTRLGNRLRVAGTAELAGWDMRLDPRRVAPLVASAQELFPRASSYRDLNAWSGLRPTTPDSVPVLGATPYDNLFLNTGHGTLGWTMACGSGKAIADLISGRTPEIDLNGLGLDRFGGGR